MCFTRTQINILGISEKQRIEHFCQFSEEETFFYTLKQQWFFYFILQFWRSAIRLSRTLYLFFQVALCHQPTVLLRHRKLCRTGTFKPYSTPLWTKNLGDKFHFRHTYIRQFFKKIIFPALIDNPNDFEINRLIRLVVSGMFLLP